MMGKQGHGMVCEFCSRNYEKSFFCLSTRGASVVLFADPYTVIDECTREK
jgi:hypothetical protein